MFNSETGIYVGYIYKIINTVNNKRYIGQTTRTLKERWRDHRSEANSNNSHMAIHRAMRKYGIENFEIVELAEIGCASQESLLKSLNYFEKLFIKEFATLVDHGGYNISEGGSSSSYRGKEVIQYNLYGEEIGRYPSILEASERTGVNDKHISRCCNGNSVTAGGYYWCFPGVIPPINAKRINRMVDEYTLDGIFIKTHACINSISESEEDRGNLYGCVNGHNIQWNNRVWRYHGDAFDKFRTTFKNGNKRKVAVIQDGNIIAFYESAKAASVATNSCHSCVIRCCNHKRSITNGLQFEYLDNININDYKVLDGVEIE